MYGIISYAVGTSPPALVYHNWLSEYYNKPLKRDKNEREAAPEGTHSHPPDRSLYHWHEERRKKERGTKNEQRKKERKNST